MSGRVGELRTAKPTPVHSARADRYIAAHERWLLLTMNVADAAYYRAAGDPVGGSVRLAALRADELARMMRPAGLTYRVPVLDDVLAAGTVVELFPSCRRAS
jgi:hypothetical protein